MTAPLAAATSGPDLTESATRRPNPVQWFRQLPNRNELVALLLLVLAVQLLPNRAPLGIYAIGLVSGASLSLHAIALVLVYRSNRIINFSQVAVGIMAASVFTTLVRYEPLLHLINPICPSDCVSSGVASAINYVISLALAVGLAILVGWGAYALVVRRFVDAPRLLLTVATIFLGYVFVAIGQYVASENGILVPSTFKDGETPRPPLDAAMLPFDVIIDLQSTQLHAWDLLTLFVAVLAVVGLVVYLRRSATGNAIQAASESPARAGTLGINVNAVTSRVWMIAAVLSAAAGLLGVMGGQTLGTDQSASAASGTLLIRALAAVVLARLVSLPLAAAAALVLGVYEQAMIWSFSSTTPLDGSLFIVIGVLLLLQSGRMSRAEQGLLGNWRAVREVRPIPKELRSLPAVRKWTRIGMVVSAIVVFGLPWVLAPSQNSRAATVMIYMIVGFSLLVLTGWAGQISLGQIGFAAVGAYAAAVSNLPFLLALMVGAAAGALAALIVGLPALRLRGLHLAIMTLAFHQAVVSVGLSPDYLGRFLPQRIESPRLLGWSLDDQRVFYYTTLLLLAGVVFAVLGLRRTRTARALIATRDNEQAAQAFGINLTRARVGAFVTSGLLCGLAGAMLAYQERGVAPGSFELSLSQDVFLSTIIGGLGSIGGPIIGFIWYGLPQIFSLPALLVTLMVGPAGLVILILSPGGIGQVVYDVRDNLLRKLAVSNRIVVPSLLADMRVTASTKDVAPIAPKFQSGGGKVFVPRRYHLERQWAVDGVAVTSKRNGSSQSDGPDLAGSAPAAAGSVIEKEQR